VIEVNINFVFFEELQEQPGKGDMVRIVVVRDYKNPDAALEDGSTDFFRLQ